MERDTPTLLSLDLGTTHHKAGLFTPAGLTVRLSSQPNQAQRTPAGVAYYDPEMLWQAVLALLQPLLAGGAGAAVKAVGLASMAETGLLIDRRSLQPRSPLIPWFDPASTPQAGRLRAQGEPQERFSRSGLRPNFKCALAKLLWLRDQDPSCLAGAVWCSVSDFIALRLTGVLATDYSLAGRTYAFDIHSKTWDAPWLAQFGLQPDLFPPALPSGAPVGLIEPAPAAQTGLPAGLPVAIAGHDHPCAAFAAAALTAAAPAGPPVYPVFDSLGTAEALVGARPDQPLGAAEFHSGLVYGCHVARGRQYWMGGLSASGGSVEWLRALLADPALSYAEVGALAAAAPAGPTGILYFPYLAGSGSPHTDLTVRAAFIGLSAAHSRAHLLKAVLEGAAYEAELIRSVAERANQLPIRAIIAAGGGTRNPHWMQIKADISGCPHAVLAQAEATLLGAALVAGIGCGIYPDEPAAFAALTPPAFTTYLPDPDRHLIYRRLFNEGYLPLQEPLRAFGRRAEFAGKTAEFI